MARPVAVLDLHPEEQRELERRVRAEGVKQRDVAERLGVSVACVNKWSQRFDREGLAGLQDMPGRGRRPTIPLETVEKVVTEAGRTPPGRQRWSTSRASSRTAPRHSNSPATNSSKASSGM